MTDDALTQRVLDYVQRPGYQPVKPRVIAKKLQLDDEQTRDLRMVVKRLAKRGLIAYGANHLVHAVARPAPHSDAPHSDVPAAEPKHRRPEPPPRAPRRKQPIDESPAESNEERQTEGRQLDEMEEEEREEIDRRAARAAEEQAARESTDRAAARAEQREARRAAKKAAQSPERAIVTGTFRRAAGGFGFVRPKSAKPGDRSEDVYIPAEATRDAASGDVVTVRIGRSRFRGRERSSGEIVEVLERQSQRFVGVYEERPDGGYVRIDGNLFSQPISVGDPGAKLVAEGDKVVVEMVRFPTHFSEGEAVLVEVLGERGAPGVDTLSIIHEFGLPDAFEEDVLESAREQAAKFNPDDLSGRQDFTRETVITIDPIDARDFDDAISLKRLENGHWQLAVHIADVVHFVPAKTPLDREARERGTSVYLPDRVLPMLPEIISNNLASLQPDKVRYSRTAVIELTADAVPVHAEVHRSAIRSCRRFTYEEVDDFLARPDEWRSKLTPEVHALLSRMHELAMIMRRRRLDHGAIELTLPEVKLDLDKSGKVVGAHVVENTESHQIIEEFMLAANEAVATLLHDQGIPCLRRVHEPPDMRKLKALSLFMRELGIECDSLESRFEIKRVVELVSGRPEAYAVNYAVLRSMQKAHYSPAEEGHYALHSKHYAHFTSPIRRYPDLTVHRLFDQLAQGKRPRETVEHLAMLGEHCSDREQRAERAERELIKVKLLTHLAERLGERMQAVITGVEPFGLFAQGVELPAEGLIHIDSLRDDVYHYDASSHSLTGRRAGHNYRLGDVIEVEIARVDPDRRALDFRLVKRSARRVALPAKKSRDPHKRRKRR
ncbi:MAG: ribonuclease R [Pirellulales bacterium]